VCVAASSRCSSSSASSSPIKVRFGGGGERNDEEEEEDDDEKNWPIGYREGETMRQMGRMERHRTSKMIFLSNRVGARRAGEAAGGLR
jgi:hypothetical protein